MDIKVGEIVEYLGSGSWTSDDTIASNRTYKVVGETTVIEISTGKIYHPTSLSYKDLWVSKTSEIRNTKIDEILK
jgi:hypothetical protein